MDLKIACRASASCAWPVIALVIPVKSRDLANSRIALLVDLGPNSILACPLNESIVD